MKVCMKVLMQCCIKICILLDKTYMKLYMKVHMKACKNTEVHVQHVVIIHSKLTNNIILGIKLECSIAQNAALRAYVYGHINVYRSHNLHTKFP